MALLTSCCCCRSLRNGSYACAIYTLVFYTIMVTACAFHVNTAINTPDILTFSVLMLTLSGLCVMSSVLLLVGLHVDNRFLLLPWIGSVTMATVLDLVISLYLFNEATEDPFLAVLLFIDYLISGLNVYCILCVMSQFQEYLDGRGFRHQYQGGDLPVLHIQSPSQEDSNGPNVGPKSLYIPNGNGTLALRSIPRSPQDAEDEAGQRLDSREQEGLRIVLTTSLMRQETEEMYDVTPPDSGDKPKNFACYMKGSDDKQDSTSSTAMLCHVKSKT